MSFKACSQSSKIARSVRDTETSHIDMLALSSVSSDDDGDEQGGHSSTTAKSLKRLFGKRLEDLFIELDEPHRTYGPGDTVHGQVNLILQKDTKVLYLRIIFQGIVRIGAGKSRVRTMLFQKHLTLWGQRTEHNCGTASKPNHMQDVAPLESSRHRTVNDVSPVREWHSSLMQAGKHVFEFEFQFDLMSLPSTVDFGRGCISYNLRCELQKPSTILSRDRSTCKKDLAFSDNIDISNLALPLVRYLESDMKAKDASMKVHASVKLLRSGFLKGESITLNIQINHVKAIKNMHGIIATLYRLSRFNSADLAPQSFRKDLCQSISPLLINPITLEYRVSPRLRAPADLFPTVRSAGPVSFRYFVEVVLDLNNRATPRSFGLSPGSISSTSSNNYEVPPIVETEALKRDRGIHCIVFEVIIGTRSSTENQQDTDAIAGAYGAGSQASSLGRLPITHLNTRLQESSRVNHSVDRRSLLSSESAQSHNARVLEQQLNDDEAHFPLSKLALQEMESALLPSLPPGTGSDDLPYTTSHALVPPEPLLDWDSNEAYSMRDM